MGDFTKNSAASVEFYKTLYASIKKAKLPQLMLNEHRGYVTASENEDKFDKVDVRYVLKDGTQVPFQVRNYSLEWWKPGFPVRDTKLKNKNEWEKLLAGELDSVWWAFGAYVFAPSEFGSFKFLKIKIVPGEALRKNAENVVGERTFDDDNHVTYIADPRSTAFLRDWS